MLYMQIALPCPYSSRDNDALSKFPNDKLMFSLSTSRTRYSVYSIATFNAVN